MTAFPSITTVTHAFASNEDPLGSPWLGNTYTGGTTTLLKSVSGVALKGPISSTGFGMQVHGTTFGPDIEMWQKVVTVTVTNGQEIFANFVRLQQDGAATVDGYVGYAELAAGADTWHIDRINNGAQTNLANGTQNISAGDYVGVKVEDSGGNPVITAYWCPAASDPTLTASWTQIVTFTDSSGSKLTGTGRCGLECQGTVTTFDDLRVGTIVTGGAPLNLTAVTGTAAAAGGTATPAYTWTAATATATAGGGTVNLARTITAASGAATAAGTSPGITVILAAAGGLATATGPGVTSALNLAATTGAATAGGGTVTLSIVGGLSLTASGGTATASGGTGSLTFTYPSATGTATAGGGTVTTARTVTAAAGAAAAAGTAPVLSFTYGAATGTATGGGGTSTASSSGAGTVNISAVTGTATATAGTSNVTFIWTATTGAASAAGGTVSRVNPATGGTATASGTNLTLRWVLPVVAGSSTAAGGTVTATSFIPTLGVIDGSSSFSSSVESTGALTGAIG